MAKTKTRGRAKSDISKSQLVRDYLVAHPDKMPKEVADTLTAQGTPVTAQLVSTIKFNEAHKGKGKGKGKRRKKVAATTGSKVAKQGADLAYSSLVAAKSFAEQAGGIAEAKKVLEALSSLR